MGNMMKQAQQLQKKMSEAQEKLNDIEVEGTSGGGMVKVISTAKGDIKRISIDETLMKKEEKEITEDLIVAAINDAKKKGEIVINDDSIKDPNFKITIAKYISKWTGRIWQVIP